MPGNKQEEMELCLCTVCASAFYSIPSYRIVRKDFDQKVKDVCTYCNCRLGYDFLISKRPNVRKGARPEIRTLESETGNE